jgi:hypothetical protein
MTASSRIKRLISDGRLPNQGSTEKNLRGWEHRPAAIVGTRGLGPACSGDLHSIRSSPGSHALSRMNPALARSQT